MSLHYVITRTHVASINGNSVVFKSKIKPKCGVAVGLLFNDAFRALSRADMLSGLPVSAIKCDGLNETQYRARVRH